MNNNKRTWITPAIERYKAEDIVNNETDSDTNQIS